MSRSARAIAVALPIALVIACGGAGTGGVSPTGTRSVSFLEVTSTAMARHDSGATVAVGTTDSARATIERLIPIATLPSGRVLVAAFQGQQRTGGYAIHITKIERTGDRLFVHATFGRPPPDAIVTQVITSPAHAVSIAASDASGLREAVLFDETGAERARVAVI